MKGTLSLDMVLTCIMVFLLAGISGCVHNTEAPSEAVTFAAASPAFAYETNTPTSKPEGDSVSFHGFGGPLGGVLIDRVEEDEAEIIVSWWECESDGFVLHRWESVRKTQTGYEKPVVVTASPDERRQVFAAWQDRWIKAQLTDMDGKIYEVSNVFLTFNPPQGLFWLYHGSGPERETRLHIMSDGTEKMIDLRLISELAAADGELKLTLYDGSKLAGVYIPFTYEGLTFTTSVYGVQYGSDGRINEVDIPFENVRSIRFQNWRDSE